MIKKASKSYLITSNGTYTVTTGDAILTGYLVGVDGATDTEVTIYNYTAASPLKVVVPETPHDASKLDPKGFVDFPIECPEGITVKVSNIGTGNVVVFWYA